MKINNVMGLSPRKKINLQVQKKNTTLRNDFNYTKTKIIVEIHYNILHSNFIYHVKNTVENECRTIRLQKAMLVTLTMVLYVF